MLIRYLNCADVRDSFQWHSSIVNAFCIRYRIKGADGKLPSKATRCANIRTIDGIMRVRVGRSEKRFGRSRRGTKAGDTYTAALAE